MLGADKDKILSALQAGRPHADDQGVRRAREVPNGPGNCLDLEIPGRRAEISSRMPAPWSSGRGTCGGCSSSSGSTRSSPSWARARSARRRWLTPWPPGSSSQRRSSTWSGAPTVPAWRIPTSRWRPCGPRHPRRDPSRAGDLSRAPGAGRPAPGGRALPGARQRIARPAAPDLRVAGGTHRLPRPARLLARRGRCRTPVPTLGPRGIPAVVPDLLRTAECRLAAVATSTRRAGSVPSAWRAGSPSTCSTTSPRRWPASAPRAWAPATSS